MGVRKPQVIKSVIGTLVGALPGIVFVYYVGTKFGVAPYVVLGLGAFIGLALTLPGVSAMNVARGTAGAIASHNVRPRHQEKVMDYFLNVGKAPAAESPPGEPSGDPPTPTL